MTQPPQAPPTGAPQRLSIEGILDGRITDASMLRAAVDALGQCGAGPFRVDLDGGRFSLIAEQPEHSGEGFDQAAQTLFLEHLQQVVDAADPGSVETNLRCKLVYPDQVAETLFSVRDGTVEPLTRRRPRSSRDAVPTLPSAPVGGMSRKQLLILAPLVLVGGLLIAWQSGWLDRAFAASAEAITADAGPFGDMIDVTVERSWGNYIVTLKRGEAYPTTPASLAERRDAAESIADRAAVDLVGNGGELFVHLRNENGDVLHQARTELRALLADADGSVTARLSGHPGAHELVLSLSADTKRR